VSARTRGAGPVRGGWPLPELTWLSIVGAAIVAVLLLALHLPHQPQPLRSKSAPVTQPAAQVQLAPGQVVAVAERRRPAWRVAAQE
jgi:hypothetical protein